MIPYLSPVPAGRYCAALGALRSVVADREHWARGRCCRRTGPRLQPRWVPSDSRIGADRNGCRIRDARISTGARIIL